MHIKTNAPFSYSCAAEKPLINMSIGSIRQIIVVAVQYLLKMLSKQFIFNFELHTRYKHLYYDGQNLDYYCS